MQIHVRSPRGLVPGVEATIDFTDPAAKLLGNYRVISLSYVNYLPSLWLVLNPRDKAHGVLIYAELTVLACNLNHPASLI